MVVVWRVAAVLGICGASLSAQERLIDNFAGVGVRAMGMGGAYVGVADDFTAVFWNPAGLAQSTDREVYVAFQRNSFDNEANSGRETVGSNLSNTRFGSMGFVYPYPVYRGRLVFAAGFNSVKNFDSIVRETGFSSADSLDFENSFSHEGELAATTLAGAVDVSPSVSLGLALNILSGEDENLQELTWTDTEDIKDYRRLVARDTFSDDFSTTYNATLGLLVRTPRNDPRLRVGVALSTGRTHKVEYRFQGVASDTSYSVVEYDDGFVSEIRSVSDSDSYKISLPLEIGIGLSYRPTPSLLLSGAAHFAEWSQSEYSDIDEEEFRANASFEDQYRDVARYHFGLEWQVPVVAIDLRAGYYTDPIPFVGPRDPRASESADNPRIEIEQDWRYLTLGAGLMLEEVVRMNIAWTRGTSEQSEGPLIEQNTVNRLAVGMTYRF